MPSSKPRASFALSLGIAGILLCAVAAFYAIRFASGLIETSDKAFVALEQGIEIVHDRTLDAKIAVEGSKLTSQSLTENLREETLEKAGDLVSKLALDEKSEQLLLQLQNADHGLAFATSSIQNLQEMLELASSLGAPIDGSFVVPAVEQIAGLRTQLKEATEIVGKIGEAASGIVEGEVQGEQLDGARKLVTRAALTLTHLDDRLQTAADTITELQKKTESARSKTHTRIRIAEVLCLLLIVWMAAGQISLARNGWKQLATRIQ